MEGAQIITTCTADKQYATILTDNMVGAGVHINAIGGDCPGKTELAPRSCTARTSLSNSRTDADRGRDPADGADHPVTESVAGDDRRRQGAHSDAQITLFDSVGFAIEDFSALRYVRDQIDGTDFTRSTCWPIPTIRAIFSGCSTAPPPEAGDRPRKKGRPWTPLRFTRSGSLFVPPGFCLRPDPRRASAPAPEKDGRSH